MAGSKKKRPREIIGTIYLIHFQTAIGDHAKHYLGWSADLESRIASHRAGSGSKLMAEVARLNIGWLLVRTWTGTRNDERRLKNRKKHSQLCPICNPLHASSNATNGGLWQHDAASSNGFDFSFSLEEVEEIAF
jgi:predicted GIY-YIG superfamily endonuclease